MSTKITYDSFAKLSDEVKQYDDWTPEILSKDEEKLKQVNDKVLPFVFQDILLRTLLNKDAGGKNRERFIDLVVLNYSRLGSKSLQEAQEMFMKKIAEIRASFPDVVKAIPSTDKTTALRIEVASKNIEPMMAALKSLNQAAMQKDLDARLALTAPSDKTAVSRPVLLAYAITQAYDEAVVAKAIDAAAATAEKALVIPAGTVASELGPASAVVELAKDAVKPASDAAKPASDAAKPASDAAKPASDAASDAAKPAADAAKPASDAAKPAAEAAGPTAAYTPPGVDDAAKPATQTAQPVQPAVANEPTDGSFLGLPIWAIVMIAVGILLLIVGVLYIVFGNRSKEEVEAEAEMTGVDVPLVAPIYLNQ